MTTNFTRRAFLQGTALGTAAVALAPLTTAARAQAKTVNVVGWNSPAHQEILINAGKAVGIDVKYDVLPAAWNDVMQKITLWGQSGFDGVDVLFADDLITGLWGMNGWADDLSGLDVTSKTSDDLVDNIKNLNAAVGGVYRQFFLLDAEPFYYNKKLVSTPPKTWEEMTSVAQGLTKGDVWGWRPLGGNGHAFNTVLLMLNQAGADLESLNDPGTLAALQYMYDWVQT
jgi:maltose-binding protein MalE